MTDNADLLVSPSIAGPTYQKSTDMRRPWKYVKLVDGTSWGGTYWERPPAYTGESSLSSYANGGDQLSPMGLYGLKGDQNGDDVVDWDLTAKCADIRDCTEAMILCSNVQSYYSATTPAADLSLRMCVHISISEDVQDFIPICDHQCTPLYIIRQQEGSIPSNYGVYGLGVINNDAQTGIDSRLIKPIPIVGNYLRVSFEYERAGGVTNALVYRIGELGVFIR